MCKLIALLLMLQLLQVFCQQYNNQCSCARDCSTSSLDTKSKQSLHNVTCSIQTSVCNIKRNARNRVPNKPKDKTNNEGWYLYTDPKNANYQKIALNISWGPQHEVSMESLQGYRVTLYGISVSGGPIYFCMNHKLDFLKHVFSTFFYDCFGKCDDNHFKPGQRGLNISVRSLPIPPTNLDDAYLQFSIDIPSCDDPRMALVYECQQLKAYSLLENVSCANNSVILDYNVPPLYGTPANLMLSKVIPGQYEPEQIKVVGNLNTSGQYEMKLPNSYGLNDNYSVLLWGDITANSSRLRKMVIFNFRSCINPDSKYIPVGIIIGVLLIIIVVVGIVIAQYFLKWNVRNIANWYHCGFKKSSIYHNEDLSAILPIRRINKELEKGKKKVKVYLIFVNDHSKHQDVIVQFASFLQADLGFDVLFELFQSKDIWADPITWMEKSLEESDKVIVIWSPGATKRWNDYNNRETADHDLFTPVLKNIKKDMFCDRNVGKYYFGYFEYCTKEDIPVEFKKSSIFHFKLMKQFEELYFRLKGMEMYMPGAVVREEKIAFDRYFDPKLTKYGPKLEQYICEMCAYAKENSDWHLMNNKNDVNINVAVVGCKNQNGKLMSNNLNIVPPVPIANLTCRVKARHLVSDQKSSSDNSKLLNQEFSILISEEVCSLPHSLFEATNSKGESITSNSNYQDEAHAVVSNCNSSVQHSNDRPSEHEIQLNENNTSNNTEEQPNFIESNNACLTKSDNLKYASSFNDNVNEVVEPRKLSHSSNNDETGYWSLQSYDEKEQHFDDFSISASSFNFESYSPKDNENVSRPLLSDTDDKLSSQHLKHVCENETSCKKPVVKLAPMVMDEDPMALLTSINIQNGSIV